MTVFKDIDSDTKNAIMPLIVFLVIAAPISVILTVGVDKLIAIVYPLHLPAFVHKALASPLIVEILKFFKNFVLIISTFFISIIIKKQLMLEKSFQLPQKNKDKNLDPYRIGEVLGSAAFNPGDRVVILSDGNEPGIVRCRNLDFPQYIWVISIVILNDQNDSVYAEFNYDARDLGYPLHRDLWSQTQRECYEKCHTETWLRYRWEN